ncbi:hypothetical protein RRG08_002076 [Elysia crispata]|uniref:Uncharacterized protein n=1 Tax=Elysia crispata TaxID=231223 RepID=A0AAE0ZM65_9GAST|nr:hypothetical protein RRG08_002076 [Elysia crispata]
MNPQPLTPLSHTARCRAVSDGTRDLYHIVQPQIAHGRFPPATQPGVGQCQMVPETCTTLSSHRSRTAGSHQSHSQVWGSVRWYPRPVPDCPATDRARQVPHQSHSSVKVSVRWYPRPVPHCPATDRARQVPASHTARYCPAIDRARQVPARHTARCRAVSDGTRDLYQIVQPQIAHGRFPPVTQPGVGQCHMVPETCT